MSRRDKQADLRRRMAEARSKLASTQASAGDLDQEDPAPAVAGKKRPLPPAAVGGGILRKSKYAAAPPAAAPAAAVAKNAPKAAEGALGSLMAGYDDSSSDDGGGGDAKPPPPSVPAPKKRVSLPAARFDDNGSDKAPLVNEGGGQHIAPGAKVEEKIHDLQRRGRAVETKATNSAGGARVLAEDAQPNGEKQNEKSAAVSDEVWDEFNALLDDDEAKAAESANADPQEGKKEKKPKRKKKKKRKQQKDPTADPYDDNAALDGVEQASYEARVGRLMLMKGQKGQRKMDETGAALPSMEEFYDPGLAFQNEEKESPSSGKPGEAEDETSNPNEEKGREGTSAASGAAPDAPPVSLAKILRDKRDQARQLSSRGEDEGDADAADGCWF